MGVVTAGFGLTKPAISSSASVPWCIFVGAAMLAPAAARPLSGVIGRPLAGALGEAGKLGRQNSMRSPRRTAQTASALMVGIALVSAIAVFGASLSKSATSSVDQAISADVDHHARRARPRNGEFGNTVPVVAGAVPGVTATSTVYSGQFEFRHSLENLLAVGTETLAQPVILNMTSGTSKALAAGKLLIDTTTANGDHLTVGDVVPVRFALTGPTTMRIGGTYQPNALAGKYLVGDGFFLRHFQNSLPTAVLLQDRRQLRGARG